MASPLEGLAILVVEDEPLAAIALGLTLGDIGAQVVTARSLQEAKVVVGRHRWSAAVLDFGLCDGNCSPVCEWLQERNIPFIVCTVHDEISTSCRTGIHVIKPVGVEGLVKILERIIHRDSP